VSNQSDAPLSTAGAVKLMTIHKSKGLEFPAVALPVLGRRLIRNYGKLLSHKDIGIALNSAQNDSEEKPSYYRATEAMLSEMEREEKKRLFM